MTKHRRAVSALTMKRLMQESDSCCAFCDQRDVATFETHHIDDNPTNDAFENLIIVCGSCHTKITRGIISPADVVTRKRELAWRSRPEQKNRAAVNVTIQGSSFKGDIAQNITKISTNRSPRVIHPPGSIGANLAMKAYVDYLIKGYFTYRKADSSYGRRTRFSHSVIHKNIQRDLGGKTFFLPEGKFDDLVQYLKDHIDATIQGKRNRSSRIDNYHSFQDHCSQFGLGTTSKSSVQ